MKEEEMNMMILNLQHRMVIITRTVLNLNGMYIKHVNKPCNKYNNRPVSHYRNEKINK